LDGLAASLSKLFNCFSQKFQCSISLNGKGKIQIDNELKFKSIDIQFEWNFPEFAAGMLEIYDQKNKIAGKVVSSHKPLRPGLRGITLFANGRQVNTPEFFGLPESSHVFSYIAGWLNVDFVDELSEDVISTNRQSLNWELPQIAILHTFLIAALRKIIIAWREKRKEASRQELPKIANFDTQNWLATMTDQIRIDVASLVESVLNETDVSAEKQAEVIGLVHKVVPDYPQYHWRHMHSEVQQVSEQAYKNGDFYSAFMEAVKRYANTIKKSTGRVDDDHPLMGAVFGPSRAGSPKILSVAAKYKRPDGSDFNARTLDNIETGQRELSQGIISGCRNPVMHEEAVDLRASNLFSEKDCLDALSILSHLFRRLDDALETIAAAKNP
jgi:uncharacterized protein (TIGR02391 family)